MYILAFIYRDNSPREYYGGGSYFVNKEKYAVLVPRENAKRFKSKKVAENAYRKLSLSCVNVGLDFEIEEAD